MEAVTNNTLPDTNTLITYNFDPHDSLDYIRFSNEGVARLFLMMMAPTNDDLHTYLEDYMEINELERGTTVYVDLEWDKYITRIDMNNIDIDNEYARELWNASPIITMDTLTLAQAREYTDIVLYEMVQMGEDNAYHRDENCRTVVEVNPWLDETDRKKYKYLTLNEFSREEAVADLTA